MERTLFYCAFCGKSQKEVKKVIAGKYASICDECVRLSVEILFEDTKLFLQELVEGNPRLVQLEKVTVPSIRNVLAEIGLNENQEYNGREFYMAIATFLDSKLAIVVKDESKMSELATLRAQISELEAKAAASLETSLAPLRTRLAELES